MKNIWTRQTEEVNRLRRENSDLRSQNKVLAHAIYYALRCFSSHQVYDKGVENFLARALYDAGLPEREAK
jgi:hypothetical protein